jgi:hypothetical protein
MKPNQSEIPVVELVFTRYITIKGKRVYKKGGGLFVFPRRVEK